eukprot:scaffold391069_cov19-Prasinocladus_malaysianus.AAC.1
MVYNSPYFTAVTQWAVYNIPPALALRICGYLKEAEEMPKCRSFMHLHLGFDATDLSDDLEMHHIV